VVRDIWQTSRGRLVVNLVGAHGGRPVLATGTAPVLVSDDGGVTWHLDACPSEVLDNGACRRNPRADDLGRSAVSAAIEGSIRTAGSLHVRRTPGGEQVSTDGGATWHDPDLPVGAGVVDELHLRTVVPLDAGGWLAVASIDPPGDFQEDMLLASDDGLRWRDLSPGGPCASAEVREDPDIVQPAVSFSAPVRFGGSWLVVHTCAGENTAVGTELLRVDASATEAVPVPGTRRDAARYGPPVAVGDAVVMLEGHEDPGDGALLQVRPSPAPRRGW
jgi:hypothetical protein